MKNEIAIILIKFREGEIWLNEASDQILNLLAESPVVVSDAHAKSSDLNAGYQMECERTEQPKPGASVAKPLPKRIDYGTKCHGTKCMNQAIKGGYFCKECVDYHIRTLREES